VRKTSPPPGFSPQTGQPVARRYTVCAIPAQFPDSFFTQHYVISEPDTESLNKLIKTHFVANMQHDATKETVASRGKKKKLLLQSEKHKENFQPDAQLMPRKQSTAGRLEVLSNGRATLAIHCNPGIESH
jgi:hypothetical protein